VDSSDSNHLNEAAQCLPKVLRNSTIAGLPLLILANKQDLSDAKDLYKVTWRPNFISRVVSIRKTDWVVLIF
jgi:signal recognition particle receptor subunit beta